MASNHKPTGRPPDGLRLDTAEANGLKDKIDRKRRHGGTYASLAAFYKHAFDKIYITPPDENKPHGKPHHDYAELKPPKSLESLKRAYENIFSGKRALGELYLKLLEECLEEDRSQLFPKHFPPAKSVSETPSTQAHVNEPPATSAFASGNPTTNQPLDKDSPNNLPDTPEHFFGHQQLRNEISQRLASNGLVVLHEVGGMGKTTFANQVAHDAMSGNLAPGGIVWINCEVNPTFEACLRTMAVVLSGTSRDGVPIEDCARYLDEHLKKQHTILIFDNYETVGTNEEFNQFLKEHLNTASLLVTTREIHNGMESYVKSLPQLSREEAEQMFTHYAGLTSVTEQDERAINEMCELVGYLPLAILLLARQATRTTLTELAGELRENIDLLTTNDAFLEPRHRSMKACFDLSFNKLLLQDYETLRLLSFPPFGIGKKFIKEYLDKTDWLSSVNNCLNSSLLQLKNDRYVLHPMVKTLLHEAMGNLKGDWQCRFVDFFCGRINQLANQSHGKAHLALRDNEDLRDEADNCWSALRVAFQSNSQDYRILCIELIEDAYEFYFGEQQKEEDFGKMEEWLMDEALPEARAEGDNRLEERILIILLGLSKRFGNFNCDEAMLNRLEELNPDRARGIRFDSRAFEDCKRGNLESAESNLRQSIAAWEALGRNFRDELQAELLNYFNVLSSSHKGAEASAVAARLWEMWEKEVLLEELPPEGTNYFIPELESGWAFAARGWGCIYSCEPDEHFARHVGEQLDNLNQGGEALRWLEKALSIQLKGMADPIFGHFYTQDGIACLRQRIARIKSAADERHS